MTTNTNLPPFPQSPYQPPMPFPGAPGLPGAPPPRGARRFGLLAALVRAPLASGELYRDVARNWGGIAAGLLLVLLAISWVAVLAKVHVGVRTFARDEFPKFVKDVPPVTIQDGVVSSPVQQPYTMTDPQTHQPLAILDTTGEVTSLDDTPAVVLVTRNKLFIKQPEQGQTRVQDLSQIKSFYLDGNRLTGWMDAFSRWLAVAVFPLALLGSFVYRLIQALIYGLVGLIFCQIFGARLDFAALMRLAVLAVVPVILLTTVLELAGVAVPGLSLLCFVIAMAYLALAVKANASPQQPILPGGFAVGTYPPPPQFGGSSYPPAAPATPPLPPQQYPPPQ